VTQQKVDYEITHSFESVL